MNGISLGAIEVLFLTLSALMLAGSLWGRQGVSQFMKRHPTIDDAASLTEFKTLVRRQMWVAIGVMFVGMVFTIVCVVITIQFLFMGLVLVLAVSAPLFLLARSSKKLETKARTMVCANQQLETEYDKVAAAWTGRLFPNF